MQARYRLDNSAAPTAGGAKRNDQKGRPPLPWRDVAGRKAWSIASNDGAGEWVSIRERSTVRGDRLHGFRVSQARPTLRLVSRRVRRRHGAPRALWRTWGTLRRRAARRQFKILRRRTCRRAVWNDLAADLSCSPLWSIRRRR